MDDQPRPDVLSRSLARTAVLLAAVACGRNSTAPPPDLPAVGGQVSLLRFPRDGGTVVAYHPDSLKPSGWTSLQKVPVLRRVLGADVDERVLWAVDADSNLLSVDLESRAVRSVLTGVTAGSLGPDGSVYLTDTGRHIVRVARRQPIRFHDSLPAPARALFAAVNDQVVALTGGREPRLITVNADQTVHSVSVPTGETRATAWGDLVAVATDEAVQLFETGGQRNQTEIPVRRARRVAFSPSGHRLYVATESPEIRVYDRFSRGSLASIALPGAPKDFRLDPSGRWLLAQPAAGDSVWVADLATSSLAATLPGGWASDLPLIAGAATLVVREGDDVVAYDLRQAPPARIARVEGGGHDLWLAAAWVPAERLPAAVAAAESATVVQDSALLATDSTRVVADSIAIYLQVSRTQNPEWAELLSKQLKGDGFPALVLKPKEEEDGYRVLVGPYPSRETAESTGKRLGRAYFLLKLPAKAP